MAKILIVDDDGNFIDAIQEIMSMLGHSPITADSVEQARRQLAHSHFDLMLLDIMLPDGSGFEVIDGIPLDKRPRHIAFVTGHAVVKSVAKSIAGPDISFLLKPINLEKIKSLLARTVDKKNSDENSDKKFNLLVGESQPMLNLYRMIERVASSRANVLIQGESGTGKELVAQAIHKLSRCDGEFVAANCGAISSELIGSELFGHEKGAFTGAVSRKIGLFERANGGSLFLDEITEMPIELQPNLLRVLETGKITRLGGSKEIEVDCRVISATNRSSQQLAVDQCLREDLYFRLAVFPINLPILADRKSDIPLLCNQFLKELNEDYGTTFQISDEDLQRLCRYQWPGNVRELRHSIHRAFILTDQEETFLKLPDTLGSPFSDEPKRTHNLSAGRTIQDVEKELITATLKEVNNNKPKAAEMLGISLKTLYNRLNEYSEPNTNVEESAESS